VADLAQTDRLGQGPAEHAAMARSVARTVASRTTCAACSGCQVKGERLAFALEVRTDKGMSGGLGPRQRTAARRQREAS
jgi:hypothetical protein